MANGLTLTHRQCERQTCQVASRPAFSIGDEGKNTFFWAFPYNFYSLNISGII